MGRHLLLQVLVVSFCIMLLALEPVPQGTILSIGANKELFPWLERVRSCWEGISFRYEWGFPGSLFLPGPRELSKQFLPEDLAKASTKEVQLPYFPSRVETTTSECVPVTWLSHIHRGIATASNSWSQTCKREREQTGSNALAEYSAMKSPMCSGWCLCSFVMVVSCSMWT